MCRLFTGADPQLWESQTRSFRIKGMVTSVRLEKMFWSVLDDIGKRDGLNVSQLLQRFYNEYIDAGHDLGNFTSFLRVCCLRFLDLRTQQLIPMGEDEPLDLLPSDEILKMEAKRNGCDRNGQSNVETVDHG